MDDVAEINTRDLMDETIDDMPVSVTYGEPEDKETVVPEVVAKAMVDGPKGVVVG